MSLMAVGSSYALSAFPVKPGMEAAFWRRNASAMHGEPALVRGRLLQDPSRAQKLFGGVISCYGLARDGHERGKRHR
jgi:hypothetical protein